MHWFVEPFLLGLQQRALIGGLIAAVMCSAVGVWMVLRGMSFFGGAFVHGVLPGIARVDALPRRHDPGPADNPNESPDAVSVL